MKIVIIHGTKRQGNRSQHVAKLVQQIGHTIEDVEVELINPADFPQVQNDGSGVGKNEYNELVDSADGFIIIAPEYNHSFPGALKTLLDGALKEYIHKPVVLMGVSAGGWGGVRVIEHLLNVVRELGLVASFADVQWPKVQNAFDKEGNLLDETAKERVLESYAELIWLAKTLKWGRENLPNKYHEKA